MNPIKLHCTETLLRRAVRSFCFLVTGWQLFTVLFLLRVFIVYSNVHGDRLWTVGVAGSVLAIG